MKYFLAVDIGASSGRHILGYVENNKLVTEEIYRFVNDAVKTVADGKIRYKWDIEHLFEEIVNGLKVAKKLGKIPVSVGIDTWGVDYVLLDEKDEPLEGAYCYRDIRTELTIPKVHEIIPFEELYDRTGIQFASFNTIYQIYDDKLSGRINNAKRLLLLPDYFHFRLSGVKVNEYTEASTTGMLNKDTRDWDDVILDRLGISKELFSKTVMPGTEIGHFTDEIVEMVGYDARS